LASLCESLTLAALSLSPRARGPSSKKRLVPFPLPSCPAREQKPPEDHCAQRSKSRPFVSFPFSFRPCLSAIWCTYFGILPLRSGIHFSCCIFSVRWKVLTLPRPPSLRFPTTSVSLLPRSLSRWLIFSSQSLSQLLF